MEGEKSVGDVTSFWWVGGMDEMVVECVKRIWNEE